MRKGGIHILSGNEHVLAQQAESAMLKAPAGAERICIILGKKRTVCDSPQTKSTTSERCWPISRGFQKASHCSVLLQLDSRFSWGVKSSKTERQDYGNQRAPGPTPNQSHCGAFMGPVEPTTSLRYFYLWASKALPEDRGATRHPGISSRRLGPVSLMGREVGRGFADLHQ